MTTAKRAIPDTYEQSLTIVSQELGHERADITEHYLR